jgi:hypothetical protein
VRDYETFQNEIKILKTLVYSLIYNGRITLISFHCMRFGSGKKYAFW